jgi:3D (Asp-Asp-Asp) domain-containing protein
MKMDKEILAISMVMAGAVALATISLTDRMDRLDRKICTLQEQVESMNSHTCTDAQIKKEVPAEPEEVQIEIRDCFRDTPEGTPEPQRDTREDEAAPTPTSEPEAKEEASRELEYAGIFELTAYEWTGNTCANGNYPTTGYTVASNYFPLGTRLYIEGLGEYTVEDTGGMASDVIDIYMGDYNSCIEFGRRQAGIYVIAESYNE